MAEAAIQVTEQAVARGLFPDTLRESLSLQLDRLERRHVEPVIAARAVDTGASIESAQLG